MLTVILQARDELTLDGSLLLREIAFYMQAGAHSTANSVIHAFHEIIHWAGADEERWQRLSDPLFVQRCVHESLRLHPASPEAWRTSMCPMSIAGAGDLDAGRRLVLDLFRANRDPSIFGAGADGFDPDRSTPRESFPPGWRSASASMPASAASSTGACPPSRGPTRTTTNMASSR
ncbi:cytochrome P450 [Rhizorhabdus histidinilytica]